MNYDPGDRWYSKFCTKGVWIDMKRFNVILSMVYDGNHGLYSACLDYGTGNLAIGSQVGC